MKPSTRRHVRRFFLVFVAIGVVAVGLAVTAIVVRDFRRAREQRKTLDAITALGGVAYYDWQFDDKMGPSDVEDFAREWSGNPALYAEIVHIDLTGSRFTDKDLELLQRCKKVRWIIVGDAQISDQGINAISERLPQCKVRP